jgi:hypothetical protein
MQSAIIRPTQPFNQSNKLSTLNTQLLKISTLYFTPTYFHNYHFIFSCGNGMTHII